MSYESMSALHEDAAFRDRVLTCCVEQALVFQNDGRADIAALARTVIASPSSAVGIFNLVCVAPDMHDVTNGQQVADGTILSAVQAQWPTYAAVTNPGAVTP